MPADLQALRAAVVEGSASRVKQYVREALDSGIAAEDILTEGFMAAMLVVGQRYETDEFYVPDLLLATRAMNEGLAILKPYLVNPATPPVGKAAIGTAPGDLHDIGKNLVGMMLEGAGFEVVDLGANATPEAFVQAIRNGAQVVAISALLTTTMMNIRGIIAAITDAGLRDKTIVIIGGAPVTQHYADEIGANGYAPDAVQAVQLVRELLGL